MTALDAARTAFHDMKVVPREAAAQRKAQSEPLAQRIANVGSIFRNELDKMMTLYKKSNPDFYNGYFAARVIVNRAATLPTKKPATPTPPTP